MGAWGYGYKDNDDYYNHIMDFSQSLLVSLRQALTRAKQGKFLDGSGDAYWVVRISTGVFRSQLMWTYQVLSSVEETALGEDDVKLLKDSIIQVRTEAKAGAAEWVDADSFLKAVNDEMDSIQAWLDGFQSSGFLMDRLGAIAESIEDKNT